jgi:CheY-like chemotaxis protein
MKRILIIEDDLTVANIYRNKFSHEGYQVEVASDGDSGLELVHSFKPDAVLLELMVPKLPGVELVKKIRSQPALAKLPVIVFSNTYLTNLVQDAWKAGATKCLSKSNCTPKQVIDVLRSILPANGASSPGATSEPGKAGVGKDTDVQFQATLRKSLIEGLPATLASLRSHLQAIFKARNETFRVAEVRELYRRVHTLTGNAGMTGMLQIAQPADALEALLKELHEKPKNINASTLRTVASCIDFLGVLFDSASLPQPPDLPAPNILVVDDEAISRRAITHSLEKARLKSVAVEDPLTAYELLSQTKFDLIFLDVDMPEMNGFELCAKIRTLPTHKKTPVVFVTSLNDFDSRTNSTMSGGSDFIAKPFLFMELAMKALLHLLRARLDSSRQSRSQNPPAQSHSAKAVPAGASP